MDVFWDLDYNLHGIFASQGWRSTVFLYSHRVEWIEKHEDENGGWNDSKQATKQSKLVSGTSDSRSHGESLSVSEILNKNNTVLFQTNYQDNNSVFEDLYTIEEIRNKKVQNTKMTSEPR